MGASTPSRHIVVATLGFTQILGYGSSYYLPAVLAGPISNDTGWSLPWVVGGLSIGLLAGGLAAPPIGRAVDQYGGRPLLVLGSLLLAIGLAAVSVSNTLWVYLLAWCVIGLGMGAALYDAAFAALGGWYREQARTPITTLTLFGGFASTICWPLTAYLESRTGWRSTCLIYAAIHLFLALPLQVWLLPRFAGQHAETQHNPPALRSRSQGLSVKHGLFLATAAALTLSATITSVIAVHLLSALQSRGLSLTDAVMIGALIGPSQVAGRLVELAWGRRLHPVWSAAISASLMAIGVAALYLDFSLVGLAVTIYAAGAGVSFVVRGTLPLALFGAHNYGTMMGTLAFPSLMAQALAPWAATFVFTRYGSEYLLGMLLLFSAAHVVTILCIISWRRTAN
jgi:MFS family permease